MMKKLVVMSLMFLLVGIGVARAEGTEEHPIQLSLFNPLQLYPETTSVEYFRWNFLYGANADVRGLDIGLVNKTTGVQRGLQWGFVNSVDQDFHGWQQGLVSINEGAGESIGVSAGFISYINGDMSGVQWGSVNVTKGVFHGVQVGVVNYANDMHGLQFGFVNVAEKIDGIMIGLVNVNKSKDPFYVLPFVNGKF